MTHLSSLSTRRARFASLGGCSLAALVLALAAPTGAQAQSFNGTGTVTSGSAFISEGPGTTDIGLFTNEVVIDWTTSAPATGTVVFQPAGTTATYAPNSGFSGDFTVLNRVIPVDVNGAPTGARIQFDGTVNSTVLGQPGGKIWFYSPNGIVVGSTASFNVGGLVLTTNPIDTTGGLYGTNGEIRFRGTAGSTGLVQVLSGASITASRNGQVPGDQAYVALVAPRIVQGGTVQADGSIGYIAAEDADITINAGLFDIFVNAGTTDGNGVVHTGTTTGAASAGTTDPRTIYMIAVPKNDGLTMLLNGSIGYAAAASATNDGAGVILSAGHLGYDFGDPLTNPANIAIGDATFSSVTRANASDSITIAPTTLTRFERFATLDAFKTVSLTAAGTAQIQANDTTGLPTDIITPPAGPLYALDVFAGLDGTGGTVSLTTTDTGAFNAAGRVRLRADGIDNPDFGTDATGGTVNVNVLGGSLSAPALELSATGTGTFFSGGGTDGAGGTITILSQGDLNTNDLVAVANGNGADGGDGTGGNGAGGSISLTANGGAITAQSISLSALGNGGNAVGNAGAGRGGSITTLVTGSGTIGAPAGFTANASGLGGFSDSDGGDAFGGSVSVTGTLGVLDFGTVELSATASGGPAGGIGGDASGGTIQVSLAGTSQSWSSLTANASVSAGGTFGLGTPAGNATGDLASGVSLDIQGVTLDLTGAVILHNNAIGQPGGGAGTFARAGRAAVAVGSGGALNAAGGLSVSADADFSISSLGLSPDYTPTMTGGLASVTVDGGSISTPSLNVHAAATGLGALLGAGGATGGTAQVIVRGNGSLNVSGPLSAPGAVSISADARGDYTTFIGSVFGTVEDGFASAAQGGNALLQLDSGAITADDISITATGRGGPSATIGGADSLGSGSGGSALIAVNGGTLTSNGGVTADASGHGGAITGGARGGTGNGGTAALDAAGGTVNVNGADLLLLADGSSQLVFGSTTGSSGNAVGGEARLSSQGTARINAPNFVTLSARGISNSGSGANGSAGVATGGLATIRAQGGTMTLGNTEVDASVAFGTGLAPQAGINRAGTARVETTGGTIGVTGDLSLSSNAAMMAESFDYGRGDGAGNQALLLASNGGTVNVSGATLIDATGIGGLDTLVNGVGGDGTGGSIEVQALAGGTITLSGDALLHANGYGGDGRGSGGLGGAGFGGSASVNQGTGGAVRVVGGLTVDTNAYGGANAVVSTVGGRATGGSSALTSQSGTLLIDGDATLTSDTTGGANPDGSFAPTVAGLIVLGTGTASPGGSIAIGGSLNATALGNAARADGRGVAGTIDTGTITVAGNTLLRTTGGIALAAANGGSLFSAGTLDVRSDAGAITSVGLLRSGAMATFQAPGGISLGTLRSGGTSSLQATAGAVTVADLLSTGAVDVVGTAVNIFSSGPLTFTNADAFTGGLSIDAAGDLVLGTIDAAGAVTLRSRNAAVTASSPVNGANVRIDAGTNANINTALAVPGALVVNAGQAVTLANPVTAASIALSAGTNVTGGALVATNALSVSAGGSVNLGAPASGATVTLSGGGDVVAAALTAAGTLDVTAGQAIALSGPASGNSIALAAGTNASTAALTATNALSVNAVGSINLGGAASGAAINLAAGTDVTTGALVASTAVGINAGGAIATNGNVSADVIRFVAGGDITTNGALTGISLIDISADGAIVANGTIDPAVLRLSAGTSITTNAAATGGTVALDAGTSIAVNAGLTANTTLDMTAAGTLTVNALATGSQITARSADIVIGTNGQIGQRGTTQSVNLINGAGSNPSFLGSTGSGTGYSLDNAELLRVFADNAIRFSVAGTAPAAVSIGDLALGFGANGNIGSGGTFGLSSAGLISVVGNLALTTSGANDTFQVDAGRFDVTTDTGSLALTGANGTMQGTLDVTAGTFAVGTSAALSQLAPGGDIGANTALMDTPGTAPAQGGVVAGSISADVSNGIYVQNAGATTAYADRRGFTTGGLAINTASSATQIVINGATINTAGVPVTGLDTVGTITINGAVAGGGGRFNARSSVNGCTIGRNCLMPGGSVIPTKPDLDGPIDPPGTNDNPTFIGDSILQVQVRKNAPGTLLPLVDEPVTGVGNEDLWGDRCASGTEACEGGN